MNIQSINHCGLLVTDLEKSRWFYGTALGMAEVPRPETFKFAGAWFRSGSCEVHLLERTFMFSSLLQNPDRVLALPLKINH